MPKTYTSIAAVTPFAFSILYHTLPSSLSWPVTWTPTLVHFTSRSLPFSQSVSQWISFLPGEKKMTCNSTKEKRYLLHTTGNEFFLSGNNGWNKKKGQIYCTWCHCQTHTTTSARLYTRDHSICSKKKSPICHMHHDSPNLKSRWMSWCIFLCKHPEHPLLESIC